MKKKKTQSGYAEFNMQDYARKLVVGVNLSPSSKKIKETIEQRNNKLKEAERIRE